MFLACKNSTKSALLSKCRCRCPQHTDMWNCRNALWEDVNILPGLCPVLSSYLVNWGFIDGHQVYWYMVWIWRGMGVTKPFSTKILTAFLRTTCSVMIYSREESKCRKRRRPWYILQWGGANEEKVQKCWKIEDTEKNDDIFFFVSFPPWRILLLPCWSTCICILLSNVK